MVTLSITKTVHFIGIGGAGMSPLARLLLQMGYKVTGSDIKESTNTIRLKDLGARLFYAHEPSNLREADIVVVSTAIPNDNEELASAIRDGMTVIRRAELLHLLMDGFQKRVSVVGTHGKSTTSSMVTRMLDICRKHPTYVIGAELLDYGNSSNLGGDEFFVAESDESDGSFLVIEPNIALVTNIEEEHMDYYETPENLFRHFKEFMEGVISRGGVLILNKDDKTIMSLVESFPKKQCFFYSIDTPSSVMASNLIYTEQGVSYTLIINDEESGDVQLQVQGVHNVYNSLASIALGVYERCSLDMVIQGISTFSGIGRRMQFIGEAGDIKVYDDYAHHPTEIIYTLKGLKQSLGRRVVAVFQPHRYTRTKYLFNEFIQAFSEADVIVLTDIYSANEKKDSSVSSESLFKELSKAHSEAYYSPKKSEVSKLLNTLLKPGDVLVTMGAGDINTVAQEMKKQLTILYYD